MTGVKSTSKDTVVITEQDFDRLRHLVESPRYRAASAIPLAPLRQELRDGTVVPPARVPRSVVTMHSRVRVRDVDADEPSTVTLVYPEEADIETGRVSVLAPMGTALLGASVGNVVEFDAPGGRRRLKVTRILYQPEAAGDFHL